MATKRPRNADVVVESPESDDPMAGSSGSAELEVRQPAPRPAVRGTLERAWVKHRLIRDFALEEKTGEELSAIYGVSRNSISAFKKRHALEIEEVRNNLADEYAGVWVAKKLARIQQYQEAAEKMAQGKTPRSAEVLVSILKAVAEELGQLPARTQVNVTNETVTYEIVGVNPDDI